MGETQEIIDETSKSQQLTAKCYFVIYCAFDENQANMKLKCLVIDDDPLICDLIQHFCSKVKEIDFCLSADNALDGLKLLTSQPFDLIFLDYNLPDLNAKSLLDMKQENTPVVMVTSHTAFAVESYDYEDIIDFIVKPLSFDRFYRAVERVLELSNRPVGKEQITEKALFVKDGTRLTQIHFDQVNFIKSESNYVVFNLGEKQVMSLLSMKELAQKLPPNFVRIHRSFMVNIKKIDYLTAEEVVVQHHTLPIGSTYKTDLMERITAL